jgi:pimeloyl-ACP methyl ester carboxylesterase
MTSTIIKVTAAIASVLIAAACGGAGSDAVAGAPSTTTTSVGTTTTVVDRPTGSYDELVGVTDGQLHIRCGGSGDATVLLIAGWDGASEDWAAVEPAIAQRTRVCSYDRFGTGTSDAPSAPQTFEMQVADLHELLDEAGEPGPYIVVGHSFGGAEAVTFASTFPDEVAGLVLVDASPATWPDTVCSVPAYAGGCAVMRDPSQGERLDVFPAFEAVAAVSSLGDLPMTVMTAAHRSPEGLTAEELTRLDMLWAEGTHAWAQLSTKARIVTVQDSGHSIQIDQPATVIDEILKLLPSLGTPLP